MQGITRQGSVISIDFSIWQTQEQFAKDRGLNPSTVRQWVSRNKRGKCDRISTVLVPELNNIYLIRDN